METKIVRVSFPEEANIILGQSHFIKTVEDLYEVLVTSAPGLKFGLAFCEASGPCLIRTDGSDDALKQAAVTIATDVGAGHSFVVVMKEGFPIHVLNAIKACPEVCGIYCATANPVEVIVAETKQGRGILGVVDGSRPRGVEGEKDIEDRKALLRRFGYKR
ncbi:MAG: adenosine-specific kinase [Candidatus Eisenbacteria bacterium]|nr:adenosine-specific kinase [Candidatus Eisenbacteria bacterium]